MFVGREKELNALEELYKEDRFQFVVVYGRRRVGKTTLLSKFCEGKGFVRMHLVPAFLVPAFLMQMHLIFQ